MQSGESYFFSCQMESQANDKTAQVSRGESIFLQNFCFPKFMLSHTDSQYESIKVTLIFKSTPVCKDLG